MSFYFLFLFSVHSMFASWGANSLPAGALCRTSAHIARLELGLLRRICLLSCPVPPRLDRLPPARAKCHFDLQADFPSHPPRLPGNWASPTVLYFSQTSTAAHALNILESLWIWEGKTSFWKCVNSKFYHYIKVIKVRCVKDNQLPLWKEG